MADKLVELTAGDADETPAEARPLFGDDRALLRLVAAVGVLVALWKLAVALTGNVIWEEAHFAVLGRHPDLAYPDVPAGWPLFAGLLTQLFGWSKAALRIPGLVVAEAIPFAVYWLARAVTTRRMALLAALIAVTAPALGVSGVIFYPEEALQIALAVMLGALIRAVRSDDRALAVWALAGLAGAVGLFVHFRFVLAGVGVFLFLVLSPAGRRQWTRPGLWLAAAIALLGLLPGLVYNMREHWPALAYQVANRPTYRFHPAWLLTFLENQLGLATPAFLIAFAAGGWIAWRRALAGDGPGALLLCVAKAIFGVYALLSLFDSQVMPHWPWLAYVALVPLAPEALAGFVDRARTVGGRRLRMAAIALGGPVVALAGGVAGSAFEWGWARADRLPAAEKPLLFTRLEDWTRLEPALARAEAEARRRFPGAAPAIAAAGHISALRLEFPADRRRRVYALDEPYDEFTRFSVIRRAWRLDEPGLRRDHAGQAVILVLPEPTYLYNTPDEMSFRGRLCREFSEIAPVEVAELPPGRTAVELYTARVTPPSAGEGCPLFPWLYVAQPTRAAVLTAGKDRGGLFGVAADPQGVVRVEGLIDGRPVAVAAPRTAVPSAPDPSPLSSDPGYPRLWWSMTLPGAALRPGEHRFSLRATLPDGQTRDSAPRTVFVH